MRKKTEIARENCRIQILVVIFLSQTKETSKSDDDDDDDDAVHKLCSQSSQSAEC